MKVTWDKNKATANIQKHGIRFPDASTVLDDPMTLTIEDSRHDEQRFVSVGTDLIGRVLVIVYSWPDYTEIRLISARKATPKERKQYENEGI